MEGKASSEFCVLCNNYLILSLLNAIEMFAIKNEPGVNYGDDVDVERNIPDKWWLEHDACKYLLSCLVHKENKDISTRPTQLVAGRTREDICEKRCKDIKAAWAVARAELPEKSGELEMKK